MPGTDGGCVVRHNHCPRRTASDGRCLRWGNILAEMCFQPRSEINLGHNRVLKQRFLSAGEIEKHEGIPEGTEQLEFLYRSILNLLS